MQIPMRSHNELMALRDQVAASKAAVDPKNLTVGDEFYVIQFTISSGVIVVNSGVFYGPTHDKGLPHLVVRLDGESERRHLTPAQLYFYPNGSAPTVVLRTIKGITIDGDIRPAYAQLVARQRTVCSYGATSGSELRCQEWPGCVIP